MEVLIEDTDNNYERIEDVLTNEGSDISSFPKMSQSLSLNSQTSISSSSPARSRSDSLFTRSAITTSKRLSILDDDSGMQRLRDIPHRVENTRGHASLAIKFADSVSDFFKKLSELNENYSKSLHGMVKQFVAKNNDLKREKNFCAGSLFNYWESIVGEVEQQSLAYQDFSHTLRDKLSLPLKALAAQKKDLLKKVFLAREEFTSDLNKQKEENQKLYKDYADNHSKMVAPNIKPALKESLTLQCQNSHNDYVLQLAASNSFSIAYHKTHLLTLLDSIEELLYNLSEEFKSYLSYYLSQNNEMLKKVVGRFEVLSDVMSNVSFSRDISHFVKLQNSAKIPEPIRFTFQDPDQSLNAGERVMSDALICNIQTQQPLSHRNNEIRQKKLSVNRQTANLTKERNSIKELFEQYAKSPEYGNKDEIEGVLLMKRIELAGVECNMSLLDGKESLFEMVDLEIECDVSIQPYVNETGKLETHHQFIPFNYKKFKKCDYCNDQLSVIKTELKCDVCYMRIHKKCQNNVSYCRGVPIREKDPTLRKESSKTSTPSSKSNKDDSDDDNYEPINEVLGDEELYNVPNAPTIPVSISSFQEADGDDARTPTNPTADDVDNGEIFEPLTIATPKRSESINTQEKTKEKVKFCISLFDYEAQDSQDLSFKKGEKMELKDWTDQDWWQATQRGKTGFVPFNYVHTLEDDEEIYITKFDFNPQSEEEIKLKIGQIVFVSRNEGDGWLHGTDGTARGIFPATYVELFDQKIHSTQ